MQKTRKILSLLLAVAMLFSLAIPSAFAADFSDVPETYQYYDAVQSLVARGIINGYDDGTFKPDATITRAEFCKMVVYSIGLGNMTETGVTETGFPDVAAEHWAASTIKTAFDLKIINGYDDGTFKPDENVTYDQALKMVICAKYDKLGEAALKNGGYPAGYRKIAGSYGFVKNISDGVYEEPAKRGTVAKLMDNMLNIKLSEITDDPSVIDTDQMEEIKGQVVAVYGASLESELSKLTKYQVKILLSNGNTVIYNGENLSNRDSLRSYLGKLVVAYYKEDMSLDRQVLSSLSTQKNRNEETTVDMDAVVLPVSDSSLSYEDEKGDTKKISIASGAKILYNGSLVPGGTTFSNLVESNINSAGSIRLLSTSGSGGAADVVFFTVYTNYLVTSANSTSKTVYLDNGTKVESKVINDEDRNKSIVIMKNGNTVSFSAISKNQILSISEDLTGNFMEVLIGPDAFTGRVSAMTRDEGTITISSKEYKFAPGVTFGADIEVGANLKIYLDAFNKIARYEFQAASTNYTYAYLTQIKNVGTGIDTDVRIEVLNLNSTSLKSFDNYPLAATVKINNVNYKTATEFDAIQALLVNSAQRYVYTDPASGKRFGADANGVHQPIKYSLTNGAVSTILVGKDNATDADLKADTSNLTNAQGIRCTTNYTGLAGIYTLNSSTKVLYVSDSENRTINDYSLKTGTNSGLKFGKYYRLALVDLNSSGTPAMVVVYNINSEDIDENANDWRSRLPEIVTKKSSSSDYNDLTVQGYNGSEKVYHDEETSFFNQVEVGDVIRVAADSDGIIDKLEIVARASDIYTGTNFVRVGSHQSDFTSDYFIDKSGSFARLIREGDHPTEDRAQISVMAGTVFSYINNQFRIALEYADSETAWDDVSLGNENHLKTMNAPESVKVVAVNFNKDNTIKSIDTNASIGELIPYRVEGQESGNTSADRVFVYRGNNDAKLIIVYRAAQ